MRAVHNPALAPPPAPSPASGRAVPPLTHHEIFALVAPFSPRGWQLDLPASDRAARQLVFRPRPRAAGAAPDDAAGATSAPAAGVRAGVLAGAQAGAQAGQAADPSAGGPALIETLVLHAGSDGRHLLTRWLQPARADAAAPTTAADTDPPLAATLEVSGQDLAAMLAAVAQVPPGRQFRHGPGWLAAHSLRLAPPGRAIPGRNAPPADGLFLVRGEVRLDAAPALRLVLRPPRVRGPSVDVELTQAAGPLPALPDDVLAVLGRGWSPLTRWRQGWRGTLRLRGSLAQRQARAAEALHRAGAHLARTLAEPPARYHARLRGTRWAVVAWRALPVLLGVAVCVAAWQVQVHDIASESMLKVIANIAPPLMLLTFFAMPELPRVEIPPLPRPRRAASWWDAPATRSEAAPASKPAPTPARP